MSRRRRGLPLVWLLVLTGCMELAATPVSRVLAAPASRQRCRRTVLEGEVRAGQGYRHGFGGGLDLLLDPIASGWVVRVLPASGVRPAEDYAGIATPPYRSVSPLLLSTDFGFRSQDAVGWNPRRFHYVANPRSFQTIETVYRRVAGEKVPAAADEGALANLAGHAPEGILDILDTRLVPGTADQTPSAALLASHFGTTAHTIDRPEGRTATGVGTINWIRFRAKLNLEPGTSVPAGLNVERYSCDAR